MTLPVSKYNSVTIILSAFVYASQIWWTLTMEATMVQKKSILDLESESSTSNLVFSLN